MSEDLVEHPFHFEGTIVRTSPLDMWYVLIDDKEGDIALYNVYPWEMDKHGWMRKRFLRGSRVEGYALLPSPGGDTYQITVMVPAGMGGVDHALWERTLAEKISEKITFLPWLFDKNARSEALQTALQKGKTANLTPETAGA